MKSINYKYLNLTLFSARFSDYLSRLVIAIVYLTDFPKINQSSFGVRFDRYSLPAEFINLVMSLPVSAISPEDLHIRIFSGVTPFSRNTIRCSI